MILLIDNYDSFSYNLVQLLGQIRPDIRVVRNDAVTVHEIRAMKPDHLVLSPGPGYPGSAGILEQAVRELAGELRILGVCEMFMCIELMTVGAMSGLGRTMEASVITIILTALRIPMAIVLGTTALGLDGVWWALTISSIIKGIVFFIYYQRIMRRWNVR